VTYLLSDWQGSTRAIVSNGGFVKARMDYTAYGEAIQAGVGLRTSALGYSATSADSLRQRYGLTERDSATGLDHTPWRKNENRAGRWTSPDPYNGSMLVSDPQSFNRNSYVQGQPTNFIDPSGLLKIQQCTKHWVWDSNGYRTWIDGCITLYDDGGASGFEMFPGDTFESPGDRDALKKAVADFFKKYGKKFRRCVWQIFSEDASGGASNVAQIMATPGTGNFPYDNVSFSRTLSWAQGVFDNGSITMKAVYRSSTLQDGTNVSALEQFFRTLAHEYANYLSWSYAGSADSFGSTEGITGDNTAGAGVPSMNVDHDTGARMEKCMWGNTSF